MSASFPGSRAARLGIDTKQPGVDGGSSLKGIEGFHPHFHQMTELFRISPMRVHRGVRPEADRSRPWQSPGVIVELMLAMAARPLAAIGAGRLAPLCMTFSKALAGRQASAPKQCLWPSSYPRASSSRNVPCSIESIPARIARLAPSLLWA